MCIRDRLITARNATDRQAAGLTVVYEGGPSNNYSYVEKGFDLAVSQLRWLQAATRCCRDGDSIALKLLIPMGAGITWCVRAAGPFRHLVRPSVPLRRCLSDVEWWQQNRESLPVYCIHRTILNTAVADASALKSPEITVKIILLSVNNWVIRYTLCQDFKSSLHSLHGQCLPSSQQIFLLLYPSISH